MKKRMNETSKICSICKIDKPLEEYHRESKGVLGRQSRCKECHKIRQRDYTSRKPEKIWVFNLRRMGLTIADYELMDRQQQSLCAICFRPETKVDNRTGKVKRLSIDHDHSCCGGKKSCKGCIRGLLCASCNHAIGLLDEDYERILALAQYVKKNSRFFT